jgi:hypothetical protein
MSKNVLYYGSKCRYSQAFLEELKTTPFIREFTFVCVDPSPSRPPLPRWLKSVPSLMASGESEPRVGPGPVNNWLFERKMGGSASVANAAKATAERNMPLSQPVYSPDVAPRPTIAGANKAAPPPVPATGGGMDGPEAYHSTEMSGSKWSDNYSFIGTVDGKTSDKMYNPIGRNFESLMPASIMGVGGGAAAAAAPKEKRSPKEEALLRQFEEYTKSRDLDIPGPAARR